MTKVVMKVDWPEHERLKAISDKSQACGEFVDWLASKKHIYLAHYPRKHERGCDGLSCIGTDEECSLDESETLAPVHMSLETLLAEFFEIDLSKIEAEKRAMLEELRATYQG